MPSRGRGVGIGSGGAGSGGTPPANNPDAPPFFVPNLDPAKWIRKVNSLGQEYWYNADDPYYRYTAGPWVGEFNRVPYHLIENPYKPPDTPRARTFGRTSSPQEAREGTAGVAVALDGRIPVVYGQQRVGGVLRGWAPPYSSWGIAQGEIGGVVSIELPVGSAWQAVGPWDETLGTYSAPFYTNVRPYVRTGGLSQTSTPAQLAITGLSLVNPGLAYVDFWSQFVPTILPDFPNPRFLINGLKVYDPRLDTLGFLAGGAPIRNSTTVVYSPNPALCLADWMTSPYYGERKADAEIDWQSVVDAANYCDVSVAGSPRHTLNITFRRPSSLRQIRDTIRGHFRCSVLRRSGRYVFVIDQAKAYTFALDSTNARPAKVTRKGATELPTSAIVKWVNPSKDYGPDQSRIDTLAAQNGYEDFNPIELPMDGINNASEAARQAAYWLNKKLKNLECSLIVTQLDQGAPIEPYDTGTYTDDKIGLAAQPLRVLRVTDTLVGEYRLDCESYDPAIYSDATAVVETKPSTSFADPYSVLSAPALPGSGSLLTEQIYSVQGSHITRGRIVVNWTPFGGSFYGGTLIKVQRAGQAQYTLGIFDAGPVVIEGTDDNTLYTVSLYTVNANNRAIVSSALVGTITTQTKVSNPADVGYIVASTNQEGRVSLRVQQSSDQDITGYEFRRIRTADVGSLTLAQQWTASTLVDRVSTTYLEESPPFGAWRYLAKAFDAAGRYSVNPVYALATVSPLNGGQLVEAGIVFTTFNQLGPTHGLYARRGTGQVAVEHYGDGSERLLACRFKTMQSIQDEIDALAGGTSSTIQDWYNAGNNKALCFPLALTNGATSGDIANMYAGTVMIGTINRNYETRFYGKASQRLGDDNPAIVSRAVPMIGTTIAGPTYAGSRVNNPATWSYRLSTNSAWAQEIISNVGAPTTPLIRYTERRLSIGLYSGQLTTDGSGNATYTFPTPLDTSIIPMVTLTPVAASNLIVRLTAVSETSFSISVLTDAGAAVSGATVYYSVDDVGIGGTIGFITV